MASARRVVLNVYERTFRQKLRSVGFKCGCVFLIYLLLSKFYDYLTTETFYYLNQTLTHPDYKEDLNVCYTTNETDSKLWKENLVVRYYHTACKCFKSIHSSYSSSFSFNRENLLISTCSQEATLLGPGQRVIAYSFYISESDPEKTESLSPKQYFDMLPENLQRIKEFYPEGWLMRVYSNINLTENKFLCDLVCKNNDFFWCDIRNIPSHGDLSSMMYMTWRDLPVGDPTVDVFGSRDLDTFVINREAEVVKDWLAISKTKPFYVMRDRKYHFADMLGGLWGASNLHFGRLAARILQERLIRESVKNREYHHWGNNFDQDILSRIFYAPYRKWVVAYDSYHCRFYKSQTMVRPFPTRRINQSDIVGNPYAFPYPFEVCPVECRPVYGKDWEHC